MDAYECGHDIVTDQERVLGIFFGICALCHRVVSQTDDEDENGMPGWELDETEYATFRGVKVEVE